MTARRQPQPGDLVRRVIYVAGAQEKDPISDGRTDGEQTFSELAWDILRFAGEGGWLDDAEDVLRRVADQWPGDADPDVVRLIDHAYVLATSRLARISRSSPVSAAIDFLGARGAWAQVRLPSISRRAADAIRSSLVAWRESAKAFGEAETPPLHIADDAIRRLSRRRTRYGCRAPALEVHRGRKARFFRPLCGDPDCGRCGSALRLAGSCQVRAGLYGASAAAAAIDAPEPLFFLTLTCAPAMREAYGPVEAIRFFSLSVTRLIKTLKAEYPDMQYVTRIEAATDGAGRQKHPDAHVAIVSPLIERAIRSAGLSTDGLRYAAQRAIGRKAGRGGPPRGRKAAVALGIQDLAARAGLGIVGIEPIVSIEGVAGYIVKQPNPGFARPDRWKSIRVSKDWDTLPIFAAEGYEEPARAQDVVRAIRGGNEDDDLPLFAGEKRKTVVRAACARHRILTADGATGAQKRRSPPDMVATWTMFGGRAAVGMTDATRSLDADLRADPHNVPVLMLAMRAVLPSDTAIDLSDADRAGHPGFVVEDGKCLIAA